MTTDEKNASSANSARDRATGFISQPVGTQITGLTVLNMKGVRFRSHSA
jgi:hypothetical protein